MASNFGGIRRKSKHIIYSVYSFIKSLENCEEKVNVFFRDAQNTVANMCNISTSTLKRICDEADSSVVQNQEAPQIIFSSPRKNIVRKKTVTSLDDFQRDVIRRSVQDFYDRGEYPTLKKLREVLWDKIEYNGGTTSQCTTIKKCGFQISQMY